MSAFDPIEITSDALRISILPFGAALIGVRLAGEDRNLVLGFADPQDHARVPICAGALAGPVANRVRNGHVTLDGTDYQMPLNEGGITCLHSGPEGLQAQNWTVAAKTASSAELTCTLPDGTNGLPGQRHVRARYEVKGKSLRLTITATTDRSTPMNIAAHPYWNLDGRADVSGHFLHLAAETFLPVDSANLPTGKRASVAGTAFDFRAPRHVPLDPALDLNFCLAGRMRKKPVHAARLTGADGTALNIATTTPGLQVYCGAHLPAGAPPTADGPPVAPFSGIALEPQHWPDAPHHDHFPQITLHPGETYRQVTRYSFSRL